MKVQGIDLNEYEILRRFAVMERYFPRCTGKFYFPSLNFYLQYDENKEETLKVEADKMLDFAGLGTYTSRIHFNMLLNAAGNINLTEDMFADITIGFDTSKDKDRVMSTLAHEICHKVLDQKGIWFKDLLEDENEIYADLATFYVGFGDLTMKGFHTEYGNEIHDMGYLTPMTYARAYFIMMAINSDVEYNIDSLPANAQRLIRLAEKESHLKTFRKLCKDNISEYFKKTVNNLAKVKLYLQEISALIDENQKALQEIDKEISFSFYPAKKDDKELLWHKMSMAFKYLQYSEEGESLGEYEKIRNTLYTLSESLEMLHSARLSKKIEMKTLKIKPQCPICGQLINKPLEEKKYHFICPQCKCHFYLDNQKGAIIEMMNEDRKIRIATTNELKKVPSIKSELELYKNEVESLRAENQKLKGKLNGKWYNKIFKKPK